MLRKMLALLAALLLLMALMLSACTGSGADDAGGETGETTEEVLGSTEMVETEPVVTLEPTVEATATAMPATATATLQPTVEPTAAVTDTIGEGAVLPQTGQIAPFRLTLLDGQSIKSMNGEILGVIEEALIDLGTQRIQYIAVDPTDVLNVTVPDGWILIPWDAVVYSPDGIAPQPTEVMTNTQTMTDTMTMSDTIQTDAAAVGSPTVFFTTFQVDVIESAPSLLPDEIQTISGPNWTSGWDAQLKNYWDPILASQRTPGTLEDGQTLTGTLPLTNTAALTGTQSLTATTTTTESLGIANQALTGLMTGNDLLGLEVQDQNGERLGEIEEVILDASSGKIEFAILATGEILGLGGKETPVPMSILNGSSADEFFIFTLPVTEELFNDLPDFELENMSPEDWNNWRQQLSEYWGGILPLQPTATP